MASPNCHASPGASSSSSPHFSILDCLKLPWGHRRNASFWFFGFFGPSLLMASSSFCSNSKSTLFRARGVFETPVHCSRSKSMGQPLVRSRWLSDPIALLFPLALLFPYCAQKRPSLSRLTTSRNDGTLVSLFDLFFLFRVNLSRGCCA